MTRARERVGLGSREGSAALMTRVIPKGGDIDRISSEYLFAAQQLGLDTDDFLPRLHVGDAADAGARRVLAEHGLTPGRYALLAPFTTRPQKHWFEDAWRRLVPLLRERFDLTSIVAGGPADMEAAARIGSGLPDVVSLAGATSLTETAALVRHAALVVGVDTGVTHMATALETPVVVLFGSTRPYLQTGRPSGQVIWLGLPCSPCHRHPTCGGAYSCLRDITPELVAERAALALESRGTA